MEGLDSGRSHWGNGAPLSARWIGSGDWRRGVRQCLPGANIWVCTASSRGCVMRCPTGCQGHMLQAPRWTGLCTTCVGRLPHARPGAYAPSTQHREFHCTAVSRCVVSIALGTVSTARHYCTRIVKWLCFHGRQPWPYRYIRRWPYRYIPKLQTTACTSNIGMVTIL